MINALRTRQDVRQFFSELHADYSAVKQDRFHQRLVGVSPMGSGADYHYRRASDFYKLIEIARDIDRNDMVVGQGVTRVCNNVVQDGFKVDPQTGDDSLDAIIESKWQEWAEDATQCHAGREWNLARITKISLRHMIIDGDVVCLPIRDTGALETVEAHRIRTPRTKKPVVHGVLKSGIGEHLEYWITRPDVDPTKPSLRVMDISRRRTFDSAGNRNLFHLWDPKRFSQTRGVSRLAPIINPAQMHTSLQFSTLLRAEIASAFAILRQLPETDETDVLTDAPQFGERTEVNLNDGTEAFLEGVAPGMILTSRAGEKVSMDSPKVPAPNYVEHSMHILGIVAVNLDLPLAAFLLDPTKTNFSGWRGAMDQARVGFRALQNLLIEKLLSPCYRWKLQQWRALDPVFDRLFAGLDATALRHAFRRPGWAYIEPEKEAKATIKRLDGGLVAFSEVAAEQGEDWTKRAARIVRDRKTYIRFGAMAARELNEEFTELKITWPVLCPGIVDPSSDDDDGVDAKPEQVQAPVKGTTELAKVGAA